MQKSRTYRFICLLAISLLCIPSFAKLGKGKDVLIADSASLFEGIAVSADMVGLFMKITNSKFANMEVSGRLNFYERYFPIVELGIGECEKIGGDNNNKFSTTAPYFRVGMDYNFNQKMNGNRLFGGVRYAHSSYKYDFFNPDFNDPVWGGTDPLNLSDMKGKSHWIELVVGVETKLWSFLRLGYNIRYRGRIKQKVSPFGEPWYVPGYGRNGSTAFGGTVNITFDIGKTSKIKRKK